MYGAILGAAVARLGGLELLVPGASTRAARKAIDALKMGADVDHFVKVKGK